MRDQAAFTDKINQLLEVLAIDCRELELDHVAIRTNDSALTDSLAEHLGERGQRLSQAVVNARPIHIYQLETPLQIGHWQTNVVELPFPNHKTYPFQSWEHVEFVVPCQTATMEALEAALTSRFPGLLTRAASMEAVTIKRSEPQGVGERLANPTIAFKHRGVSVKFHPYSLAEIIASEAHF
ncbi:VOC family protein [Salinivibrio kushneri]|uniref:VOC family protein n=1 Tax=Salinivibrio kushneri TaxID=1908198 RepID=A0AA47LS26_9GAMM|nr:VOC family protein [Salinivibrio kushneri]WBA09494.1 VOC family protein [Salinivibrio kushneri]